MANMIRWFEIPVKDLQRAVKFYSKIFKTELTIMSDGHREMAVFPIEESEEVTGALVSGAGYNPGSEGALIYLNANPDLSAVLKRVGEAGGVVVAPKQKIGSEFGYMAIILDSEGNRIALNSKE
ncbi:MAG: VOC family protein [Ignavibacteriales bacterium]|nr:MAG: VOC family protein [Ignavibacteriaceae bacterium]MBW7871797.1 VOC family protein [Ignavibacteria bacterium]MCZ2144353.1 VOC family protein [Ignavibacteriales bacterium]OQY72413.1 MAG: hypothetical protein B6D45_09145 [Ignavibacteriales bacterium UTCHB3]MBV6446306.1 hypothetical protein [Ignavibacteriaceae bacterium]